MQWIRNDNYYWLPSAQRHFEFLTQVSNVPQDIIEWILMPYLNDCVTYDRYGQEYRESVYLGVHDFDHPALDERHPCNLLKKRKLIG